MPVAEFGHCIEASGISKIYRAGTRAAVEAVSTVSFSVPHGKFVAILGPSGCGKSTLLMMVGGLEPVSGGSIVIDGSPMTGPRTSIGIMFQDPTLLPWKTALANVALLTAIDSDKSAAWSRPHCSKVAARLNPHQTSK